jgi:hypothetical protein
VAQRCRYFADTNKKQNVYAEYAEAETSAETQATRDAQTQVGARGWALKFQLKYRGFSFHTLGKLRALFSASKISAASAASEVHALNPSNPLVMFHVTEGRVKNFFGKLASAKKAKIDLSLVTDQTEMEGRMSDSKASLKAECDRCGLKKGGKKEELVARLARHDVGAALESDQTAAALLGKYGAFKVQELAAEVESRNKTRTGKNAIATHPQTKKSLINRLEKDDGQLAIRAAVRKGIENGVAFDPADDSLRGGEGDDDLHDSDNDEPGC